jgi:hypothetical protein
MIRCCEIVPKDLEAVADLLTRGFPVRSRDYWMDGLRRQAERQVPDGFPRFGYMLERDGRPVGVLLLIYSERERDGKREIRCNLSSWYVETAFRNYAPILTKIAHRHQNVVYLNISPAHWTWQTIEAQGFRTYCGGLFFSFPALSRPEAGMRVEPIRPDTLAIEGLPDADVTLLARHATYGCLSLVCRAIDGRTFPFVLQSMRKRGVPLPAMQIIYCRETIDYVVCAGAIGRFLLKRGRISVALDANGPVKDLIGIYRESRRKYFKGPRCPELADLLDTELVIYGP